MHLTINIPDDVAERLKAAGERPVSASHREDYKRGQLTKPQLRRLLGFGTRDALDGFLKAHAIFESYSLVDLARERNDLERSGS